MKGVYMQSDFFKNRFKQWVLPIIVTAIIILVAVIKSCSFSVFDPHLSQPGTFFLSDRSRFIYVDKDVVDNTTFYVMVDRVTNVMYLAVWDNGIKSLTPLYNEDGSLIIYDSVGKD